MIGQIILWIVVIALFLIGLTGTILPTLPGNILIFGGALVYGIFTEFEEVTLWVLAALLGISIGAQVLDYAAEAYGAKRFGATKYGMWIGAQVLDYAAEAYGAKRFGATKYGMWGAIIGGVVGLITLNVGGLVLGIFLGAIIPEIIVAGRSVKGALKIGWGSLLGFLGGTFMKFILGLVSIGIFVAALASCSRG
jgi:uncharacterized protein YqgC (DUF456 family)